MRNQTVGWYYFWLIVGMQHFALMMMNDDALNWKAWPMANLLFLFILWSLSYGRCQLDTHSNCSKSCSVPDNNTIASKLPNKYYVLFDKLTFGFRNSDYTHPSIYSDLSDEPKYLLSREYCALNRKLAHYF